MIYNLITCWKVNKGKINLENIKTKVIKERKAKDNWLTKKKGINCGINIIKKLKGSYIKID